MNITRRLLFSPGILLWSLVFAQPTYADDPTDPGAAEWSTLETPYYRLRFAADKKSDADQIRGHLDRTIEALKKEFAAVNAEELLRGVDCQITLHTKPNARANEGLANISCGVVDGKYKAEMDLLTPSAYGKGALSSVGEPKGDDYQAKLVAHEYSSILLDRITRSKAAGWRFFSAPAWFVQGYEEYAGLMCSSHHNREVVRGKYLKHHKDDPRRVGIGFGVGVRDTYIDGATLLLFMNEAFGRDRVQAILASEKPTFEEAVPAALGVNLEEFANRWKEWCRNLP